MNSLHAPRSAFHTLCLALHTLLLLFLGACVSHPELAPGSTIPLATFNENGVAVTIVLERDAAGSTFLAATFTPLESGYHLYSKDIPRNGIDGLGRPTLLELTPDSKMKVLGSLIESTGSTAPAEGPETLRIYPAGPVTLRLPIALPPGESGWVSDQVSITFMICSGKKCRPPVVNRIVPVRVPGAEALSNP